MWCLERFTSGVARCSCHPNGGSRYPIDYRTCRLVRRGVTHVRSVVQQWTACRVVVIALARLSFPLLRPYRAYACLAITNVLIAITAENIFLLKIAGRVVRLRLAGWISAALALCGADGMTVGSLQPTFDRIAISRPSVQIVAAGGWQDC